MVNKICGKLTRKKGKNIERLISWKILRTFKRKKIEIVIFKILL